MQTQRTFLYPILIIILLVAGLVGLVWANGRYMLQSNGQTDLALGWSASYAWLIKGVSPYDPSVIQAAEDKINPDQNGSTVNTANLKFFEPLYSLIFFAPFTLIDFGISRILWVTLIEIGFFILILLCLKVSGWKLPAWGNALVLLIFLVWYNGARTILTGQFIIITLILIVGALVLITHHQDITAGFLLALSTSRPDISFLIVIYVILWSLITKRHLLLTSLLASLGFLWITSILLLPEWPLRWIRAMVALPDRINLYRTALSLLSRSLPGIRVPFSIFLHGITVLFLLWIWVRSMKKDQKQFMWTALFTLVITALVGFRVDSSYSLLLLPGLFLINQVWQERWKVGGQVASWIVLSLILIISWVFYLQTVKNGGTEPKVMYILPPLTIIIGLYWIRWWAIRSPQMPFDLLRDRYSL